MTTAQPISPRSASQPLTSSAASAFVRDLILNPAAANTRPIDIPPSSPRDSLAQLERSPRSAGVSRRTQRGGSPRFDEFNYDDERALRAGRAGPSSRGRDVSPKNLPNLNDRSPPPGGFSSLPSTARRGSATQLASHEFQAHHQPPAVDAPPSADPILYLPPLMSKLPHGHAHAHTHTHEHEYADGDGEFDTRLPNIDPASLALHQALHYFRPLDNAYASTEYSSAFNWNELLLDPDVDREWYAVVFRSRRRPESSSLSLYAADRAAHAEAVQNGGLVMYWYGVPDETGLNLATCIWQSRKHAINAISGPKHIDAMKQARGAYETYDLERWVVRKAVGENTVSLSRWDGGEVGW